MLFDYEINENTSQYIGLYLESLATTAALYTVTAGLVNRSRPYVFDNREILLMTKDSKITDNDPFTQVT